MTSKIKLLVCSMLLIVGCEKPYEEVTPPKKLQGFKVIRDKNFKVILGDVLRSFTCADYYSTNCGYRLTNCCMDEKTECEEPFSLRCVGNIYEEYKDPNVY